MKSTGMTGNPKNLPAVFQNFLPVCWNCFMAENYRRQHPERLVDRGWERGVGGEYVRKEPTEDLPAETSRRQLSEP